MVSLKKFVSAVFCIGLLCSATQPVFAMEQDMEMDLDHMTVLKAKLENVSRVHQGIVNRMEDIKKEKSYLSNYEQLAKRGDELYENQNLKHDDGLQEELKKVRYCLDCFGPFGKTLVKPIPNHFYGMEFMRLLKQKNEMEQEQNYLFFVTGKESHFTVDDVTEFSSRFVKESEEWKKKNGGV